MRIYKQELAPATFISKNVLPYKTAEEARRGILKLDLQYDIPCMWYLMDENETKGKEYIIFSVGTGHNLRNTVKREEYVGTVILDDGALVLHYFLIEVNEFDSRCREYRDKERDEMQSREKSDIENEDDGQWEKVN